MLFAWGRATQTPPHQSSPGHAPSGLQGASQRSLLLGSSALSLTRRTPAPQAPRFCWPDSPADALRLSPAQKRPPPHTHTIYVCAAHCCLISTPTRGRTLNSGKAQCPHVRLSVRSFACNHGLARPAPATAGAGLRWGEVGGRYSRGGRGDEGRTPSSPAPRQSRAGAPPEPCRSPAGARPQPQPEPAPAEPERRTPRPGGAGAPAGESRGAALRGSLGRGV